MTPPTTPPAQQQFPCKQCGAALKFEPGHDSLKCPYCGMENSLAPVKEVIEALDFQAQLRALAEGEPEHDTVTVKCAACAAETTLPPNETADMCPFCGAPIVATGSSKKAIRPKSLLPFKVNKDQACERFRKWVSGLWFAPSALAKNAERAAIHGTYLPAWTYDSDTYTDYTGERGDDYTETETYTTTENGQAVTRTREVIKTRWSYASGRVAERFDNVLVMASSSLPPRHLNALQPWDLENLVPYADEYLSGFVSESYQVDLPDGFEKARAIMDVAIRRTIERAIGGDHQRISSVNTSYDNVMFKHLLLPVWISAYRYLEKVYHFLVNARTGEVRGERPYSTMKIALAVLVAVLIVVILFFLMHRR